MYQVLWKTTGQVDLYSPSCHFWAGDQPHSNILQMMLIKMQSVTEVNLMMLHGRILNRLSTEVYSGQLMMFWDLSPGYLLVIILLIFKVLHFSGHSQSLCPLSLSCLSSPSILSISFLTVLDKAAHLLSSCLYHCLTHVLSLWSSKSPFKAQFIPTLSGNFLIIPVQCTASFS